MTQFSRTWWGQRFLEALEQCTDAGRLGRGRAYARNGKVREYRLEGHTVTAKVRGSINPYFGVYKEPTYTTTVSMAPIVTTDWFRAIDELSSRAGFVARLLMNEMPPNIDDTLADLGLHLLPHGERDLVTRCSCPDWSNPCKHVAGVYYLLAADLDRDPFLLFELRGLARDVLRDRLENSPLGRILAAELTPRETPIEPATSYHTRPMRQPTGEIRLKEFWLSARRLPELGPSTPPAVPALLVRKGGDYPAFWRKDASFIATMEELYERVRTKSPQMK